MKIISWSFTAGFVVLFTSVQLNIINNVNWENINLNLSNNSDKLVTVKA